MVTLGQNFETEVAAMQFVNLLSRLPKGSPIRFVVDGQTHFGAFMALEETTAVVISKAVDGPTLATWRVNINDLLVDIDDGKKEEAVQLPSTDGEEAAPPAEEKPAEE